MKVCIYNTDNEMIMQGVNKPNIYKDEHDNTYIDYNDSKIQVTIEEMITENPEPTATQKRTGTQWIRENGVTIKRTIIEDKTPEELEAEALQAQQKSMKDIDNAIENHMDAEALAWGYQVDGKGSIDRAISYIGSAIQEWDLEGQMFKNWRDGIWTYVYIELQKVENGERELPTPESVLTEIPQIETYKNELGL